MRRALLALTAALLLVAIAALAFWPGQLTVEPAAPAVGTPGAGQQDSESCSSCTLRHQRLSEPQE